MTHYICIHTEETFQKTSRDETTQALTQLDRNQRTLERFLAVLCHDLATSLRSAADAVSFFKSHYATDLPQAAASHFADILDSIRQAQSLTDDLVMYYQVPHEIKGTKSVDLNVVLQAIRRKFRKKQSTKAFCLTYSPLPTIFARQSEVFKVFEYLIQNVARIYYPFFSCKISVSARKEKTFWLFRIASTVSGTVQHLQREATLFHKASFATANGSQSEITELNVCKKIIATYGGTIWIERGDRRTRVSHFLHIASRYRRTAHRRTPPQKICQ